ncbi:hypothetical protein QX249_12360 [Vibrio parahaemolyticus]|uniref:Type I-B CRISPR-associated protein Cas7/Cst2/DevR n=1 Tax=Vibrio parahaemolyticus TaxID=670 RepID=A0AAW8PYZ1_VIBPH|nr:hypothetical protein [Vibrio parahaemolyticus]MDS1821456.1 hypothetical protein [Vibrio parahaemolyticus]
MHPIQQLCLSIAVTPLNGRLDNEPSGAVREVSGFVSRGLDIYDLFGNSKRIEIFTDLSRGGSKYDRQIFRSAKIYFPKIDEPIELNLQSSSIPTPEFPRQIFKINKNQGSLELLEGNPYFSSYEDAIAQVFCFYLAISKLTGFEGLEERGVVEKVVIDSELRTVETVKVPEITLEDERRILDCLKGRFVSESDLDGLLEHFSIHFCQTEQKGGYSKELLESVKGGLLSEGSLSPETTVKDALKGLASSEHGLRNNVNLYTYCEKLIHDMGIITFPIQTEMEGIYINSTVEFFKTDSGIKLAEHLGELIIHEIESRGMTLSDLKRMTHAIHRA